MEISDFGDSGAESVSDHEPGFDFLAKQSVNSNSVIVSEQEEGAVAEATEQSFNSRAVEDDGFRTPTSIERKIKTIETCPPAPRKPPPPTPPSRKRKALFPVDQSAMLVEFSPGKNARVFTAPAKVM